MARLARVVAVDVAHHVTQRGNARQFILTSDAERMVYLDLLRQTVAGQASFTYSYDVINHLTSITQGTKSVQFTYDSAGRPATQTLPSGLAATYTYDGGSRLTGISYSANQVFIGNLTYSYDALNRRVGVGGTLAATALPPALAAATYDAANQITNWNGAAVSYDANGSMVSDGSNNFAWDARGQLASITGAVTAGFGYDALGRRISKAVGPYALGYVYDGGGITQELTGGTVTATVWSGGSSGFVERTDSSGTVAPLTDALGNVIGLADANGNLASQYYYDPFGGTTATGAPSGNPFQYIGRENDLTGLYYMHARYYSPALMRFISEDPLGLAGGDVNLHAYTGNSPSNFSDPSGTSSTVQDCLIGAGLNVTLNLLADYITARKSTIADAFSVATMRYAAEGCEGGIIGGAVGEYVIAPLAKAAFSYAADFFTSETVAAARTAIVEAADGVGQSVTDALQNIADRAVQTFEQEGFTPAQEAAIAQNPGLEAMYQGERIDYFAREIFEDSGLADQGIRMTPRGTFGPDFYNPVTREWWDITTTTPGTWEAHVAKYPRFGQGTILIY